MRVVVAAGTDIGHVREGNEDTYLLQEPLFAVADGMGGHRGGEVASRLAIETMERRFARGERSLAELVREANHAVFERSISDRAVAGMGTTLTAALVEGDRLRLGHVGDSRAYLFRDGALRQLTEDHTLVARMVKDGELTPEEAEIHPHRSIITRTIGVEPDVDVDELDLTLEVGDRILVCSDGLTGMLPDARIAEILTAQPSPSAAVHHLIAEANEAGGVDNITAILLAVEEGPPVEPPGAATQGRVEPSPPAEPGARQATTDAGGGGGPPEAAGPAEEEPPRPSPRPLARARRPLIWAGATLALLLLAFVGLRLYLDTQWYVGVNDGRVAIFQGMPTEVGGFELSRVVVETTISAEEATGLALYRDLEDGITARDRAEADAIVERIRNDLAVASGRSPEPPP